LKECAARGDPEVAGRQAHSINGAAGSIGGKALREAAFGVEKAWRDGDAGQLAATTSRLESRFEELRRTLLSIKRTPR
jgi:HPt (histidine-containing phosphotransfer) domain-containing protein